MTACSDVTIDTASKDKGWSGGAYKTADRYESNLTAIDPVSGEIKKTVHLRYPNYSETVSTGGGLVFLGLPLRRSTTPRSNSSGKSMSAPASRHLP
jgi:hypothetical protein